MAINPIIKQKAEDIRKKIFGSEVRESLASGIEAISEDVEATIGRQDYVEEQFQNVIDETTDKDVISAPELIAARNGKSNLKARLDEEHAQVTAQLQQTGSQIEKNKTDINLRVDQIIVTPTEGITEQEIIDARQSEASLGANFTKIKDDLINVSTGEGINDGAITAKKTSFFQMGKNLFNKDTVLHGFYIQYTSGNLVANAGYTTSDYIRVEPNMPYSFVSTNLRLAFYDKDKAYISGLSAPVSPLTTPANTEYVRFSGMYRDVEQFEKGSVNTEYEPYTGFTFDGSLIKNNSIPPNKVKGADSFIATDIIVDMTPTVIYFYIKCAKDSSNKYLKYSFHYQQVSFDGVNDRGNLAAWCLKNLFLVERTGEFTFSEIYSESLTTDGVWEFAIKENGMPQFMGGGHGNELLTSVFMLADGIKKELGTTQKFICKKITFVQKSTLYRVLTQIPVADTVKIYDVDAINGIKLTTEIKWLVSLILSGESYLPMLPIKRVLTDGVTQITDKFYRNTDYEIKDVSTPALVVSSGAKNQVSGVDRAVLWGTNSKIHAEVIVTEKPDIPAEIMYVADSTLYNKFYWSITGGQYTTSINEKMKSVVFYKINTGI